jgi:dTDP-glucose 4,6-dehydratase
MNRLWHDLELIRAATQELWEEMRGQRLFVTGGTGFFGCWLVESFCHVNRELGLGARATVLSRAPVKFAAKCPHLAGDPAITMLRGDVRDFDFPAGEFRYVIHAATEASLKQSQEQPLEMLSTILAGTERTLEFAAQCGGGVWQAAAGDDARAGDLCGRARSAGRSQRVCGGEAGE